MRTSNNLWPPTGTEIAFILWFFLVLNISPLFLAFENGYSGRRLVLVIMIWIVINPAILLCLDSRMTLRQRTAKELGITKEYSTFWKDFCRRFLLYCIFSFIMWPILAYTIFSKWYAIPISTFVVLMIMEIRDIVKDKKKLPPDLLGNQDDEINKWDTCRNILHLLGLLRGYNVFVFSCLGINNSC